MPAFASFDAENVTLTPTRRGKTINPGVTRWNCPDCGSPLLAQFDYLPGQSYVPLGIIDAPETLAPELHAHSANALPWLAHMDDVPREPASSRATLNEKAGKND